MNDYVGFRTAFVCAEGERPVLRIAASSLYRVTLNGEHTGYGPARAPEGMARVDEWPLKTRTGENVLAIEVSAYNANVFCLVENPAFLQAEVVVGGRVLAATAKNGPFDARDLHRVVKCSRYSFQRAFGEGYRLRAGDDAWWRSAAESPLPLELCAAPRLMARGVPLPDLSLTPLFRPLTATQVSYDADASVRRIRFIDGVSSKFKAYQPEELELNLWQELHRFSYSDWQVPVGNSSAADLAAGSGIVFDGGMNRTGFPMLHVRCTRAGRLWISFDEILHRGKVNPLRYEVANGVCWDLQPGEYDLETFEPYTLRYLHVFAQSGEMTISALRMRRYQNAAAASVRIRSSDPDLDAVFSAAAASFAQNAVDGFMDCPSRERACWLCDSSFTAQASRYLSGGLSQERLFLENFALAESFRASPSWKIPGCYPADHLDGLTISNWPWWLVIQTEDYLARGGDRELAYRLRQRLIDYVEHWRGCLNADGLIERLSGDPIIDYSLADQLKNDVNYPLNMLWAETLDSLGRMYGLQNYSDEAERVREKIVEQSWDGRWFHDHAVRQPDGSLKVQPETSEACQYYAFRFGLASRETHADLWERLVSDFGPRRLGADRKTPTCHPDVAPCNLFIGHVLRLQLLAQAGLDDQFVAEMKDYLKPMVDRTGTLWECGRLLNYMWDAEGDAPVVSCCHAFASATAAWCLERVAGIERIDQESKTVRVVRPTVGLSDFRVSLPVSDGHVHYGWRRSGEKIETAFRGPPGWRLVTAGWMAGESPSERVMERLRKVAASENVYWAWTSQYLDIWDGKGYRRCAVRDPNGSYRPVRGELAQLESEILKHTQGRRALINYWELFGVAGTWWPEQYYAANRASTTAQVKKLWKDHGAIPVFTWHIDNPCCTNGFPKNDSFRFVGDGICSNMVRCILDGTQIPCGRDTIAVKNARGPLDSPRTWYFRALDEIASFYSGLVDDRTGVPIPIVMRYPHEMDGDWFWWGSRFCSRDEYRRFCRMTADYLRSKCGEKRILFALTSDIAWWEFGQEGDETNTFLAYYPGNDYVDILGVDDYSIGHRSDDKIERATAETIRKLRLLTSFAKKRGQVVSISECGGTNKRDDFWRYVQRIVSAPDVEVAFVDTWTDKYGTLPDTTAAAEDLHEFVRRPTTLLSGKNCDQAFRWD